MTIAIMACALSATAAQPSTNACDVLSQKDVAAVQGESYAERKLSTTTEGAVRISQCFYRLPTFSKSLSVTVMRDAVGSARGATIAWWNARFASTEPSEERDEGKSARTESRGREEGNESGHGPVRVDGIGDQAIWTGNRLMGELDVLDHGAVVRVSVGGAGDVEQRIAKSKRLAAIMLKRLRGELAVIGDR